jgi:pimeloyl-ACP methyl ester carboxylesterase
MLRPLFRLAVALVLALTAAVTLHPGPATAAVVSGGTGRISDIPVAFAVHNTNTSAVPCPSDGNAYTVRGHLVGPATAPAGPGSRTAVLYLHGLDAGEWFWNFSGSAGYNHAREMAKLGYTSVVIDRIGYGGAQPVGVLSCLGAQADVAHQIIGLLRSGSYNAGGGSAPRFDKIVLAGHSIGGAIAQVEAYSYRDIDGLAVLLWADNAPTRDALAKFLTAGQVCLTGGQKAEPTGAPAYAYFAPNTQSFKSDLFQDAKPEVLDAAASLQNRNPCGDLASVLGAIGTDQVKLADVTVPVLLVYGDHDTVFDVATATRGPLAQRNLYRGNNDVSEVTLYDTGHFMTMERSAPQFRSALASWLCGHGFGDARCGR